MLSLSTSRWLTQSFSFLIGSCGAAARHLGFGSNWFPLVVVSWNRTLLRVNGNCITFSWGLLLLNAISPHSLKRHCCWPRVEWLRPGATWLWLPFPRRPRLCLHWSSLQTGIHWLLLCLLVSSFNRIILLLFPLAFDDLCPKTACC